MSPLYRLNFRREAFRRARAEAWTRAIGLGIWLAYFGVLTVVVGLYALNLDSLRRRSEGLGRQIARQHAVGTAGADWVASPEDAALAEPWVGDVARWRDLLVRLPRLLPEGGRLTALQWNPDELTGGERRLVLNGLLRAERDADPTAAVTDLVSAIAADSLVSAHFRSVRLVSTRTATDGTAEFQVECR
ncbi:MAG: hypothetical protein ACKO3S_03840 [bacterium]